MPYKNKEKQKEYNRKYLKKYNKKNKEKKIKWQREWREKNHEKYLEYNRIYLKKRRKLYPEKFKEYSQKQGTKTRQLVKERLHKVRLEMGGKCFRCGYSEYIDILVFHHNNGDKNIEVTKLMREEAIKTEANKCILLCPNCHAIEHFI